MKALLVVNNNIVLANGQNVVFLKTTDGGKL